MEYTLYDIEALPDVHLAALGTTRLELFYVLSRQKMLTEISTLALLSTAFSRLYSLPEVKLKARVDKTFPEMPNRNLRKLDAVFALCKNNYCDTCLEEEGDVWGYRARPSEGLEILLLIVLTVKDYESVQSLALTCVSLHQKLQKSVPRLVENWLTFNLPIMTKEVTWIPETLCSFFTWCRHFFFTEDCLQFCARGRCMQAALSAGATDFFLLHENAKNVSTIKKWVPQIFARAPLATIFQIYQESYHELGYGYGYHVANLFDTGGDPTSILFLVRAILGLNKDGASFVAGLLTSPTLSTLLPAPMLVIKERKLTMGELLMRLTQTDPVRMKDVEYAKEYYERYESLITTA